MRGASRHRAGDRIRVVYQGLSHAYLAASPKALKKLCALSKAKSEAQAGALLGQLIAEGIIWVVPPGTEAEVVRNEWPMVRIRITHQGHGLAGETAWIPHEFALPV